ncbi:hypothetical protein Efla_007249 [Eimeria flavescens]
MEPQASGLEAEQKGLTGVLCAYAAARASCDGPQLPPFVKFNEHHLPSEFPSEFLAAHAAFCLKDGEAPQVPDYLVTDIDTTCSSSSCASEKETRALPSSSGTPDVKTQQDDNVQQKSNGQAGASGRRSFQYRALRRALEFRLPGHSGFESLKTPLIEFVMQASSDNVHASQAACTSSSADSEKKAARKDAPSNGSLCNPLMADTAEAPDSMLHPSSKDGVAAPIVHSSHEEGGRTGSGVTDNPLLEARGDGDVQQGATGEDAAAKRELRSSEEVFTRKRRGLSTAAMRQKNLEQVSRECQGNNLCLSQAACGECSAPQCNKSHDVAAFMKTRPQDLEGSCVFVSRHGICPYGCCCRFGRSHINASGCNLRRDGQPVIAADLQKYYEAQRSEELNMIVEQHKTYFVSRSPRGSKAAASRSTSRPATSDAAKASEATSVGGSLTQTDELEAPAGQERSGLGAVGITDDDLRRQERRRRFAAQVTGKTFLAPLTTLGNLPFRRLCTRLGADVTVSEMAVANSLVEGKSSELSLLRRHCTEKIFGIQVAAGFPDVARDCSKLINDLGISCDFIDLNIACPLDQLHRKFKAGSCMLEKPAIVESVVKGLVESCPSIPVTVKVRTAHYGKHHQLHLHMERLSRSGVSAIFAHGRTAQQRYSKSADWDYLSRCKELMPEDVLLIGCGDILSSAEYHYRRQTAGMDALMIGRGALIKPWIFTEIKENRLWDISAPERLSYVKEFVDNGLEHWGSDRRGVANTRRFLLELLSFMHRYIPPPFLELQPQVIQWRPSAFKGRSDLEVKLSSPNPSDWVDISSMFLGPPPKGFTFVPKHASSSYYVAES